MALLAYFQHTDSVLPKPNVTLLMAVPVLTHMAANKEMKTGTTQYTQPARQGREPYAALQAYRAYNHFTPKEKSFSDSDN